MSSYRNTNNNDNSSRYIPRDGDRDRRDDRLDDRHEDQRPCRDVYYRDFKEEYGKPVARNIYGEDNTPITHPSICIPRTFTTIRGKPTKAVVFNTLRDLKIGHIERIDVVHKTDSRGERYCTIYVHLQWNVRNQLGRETRQKLLDGNEIKIVYDDPWFWKCSMSTMEKPAREGGNGGSGAPRPRIDLGDGVKAVSRYNRDQDQHYDEEPRHQQRGSEEEQHNPEQLCNMDPYEESD